MTGAADLPGRLVGGVAIYLLGSLAAHGQALHGCVRPTGMPPVPDGSNATLAEMQAAREAVETYVSEGEAYVRCLADAPYHPTTAAISDQVIAQMDLVVDRFNGALCAYSHGTQCMQTAMRNRPAAALVDDEPTASMSDMRANDSDEPDEGYGQFEQYDVVASGGTGLENSGNADSFDSAQASLQQPPLSATSGDQIDEPVLGEPTLPDGTPCGSVTQIRNDVTGAGVSSRAYYIWDIHNACFEPIRVRWTFSGDGLLKAQRLVPARGAQRVGCSTRRGTVSSRYCAGGIEYAFEWP